MFNIIMTVVAVISGIAFLICLKVEYDRQERQERRLKRRIVRAYYYGKREGIDEWLSK